MFSDSGESGDGRMKTVYTYYRDDYPGLKIAQIIINESIEGKTAELVILERKLIPLDMEMVYENNNTLEGIETLLESRVVQSNRMFLGEYCKERDLCPDDLDDRLEISHGRTYEDKFYIEREVVEYGI